MATTYSRVIWINHVRLQNLLVVSSTEKLSVLTDASGVSTSICTGTVLLFVYQVYIYLGGHVRSCTVHCVLFLFLIHSGHQVRWTYQPGSQRRKVTQDVSSPFFLRSVVV